MGSIVIDAVTAAFLDGVAGHPIGHVAQAVVAAVAGTYEGIENGPSGRTVGWAEFTTARDVTSGRHVTLAEPGWDPFSSMDGHREMKGLPPMWGGVIEDGDTHRLRVSGIRLRADVVVVPYRARGIFLVGHEISATMRVAAVGRPLGDVATGLPDAAAAMTIKRVRQARGADQDLLEKREAPTGGGRPAPDAAVPGVVVVVEASPDVLVQTRS